MNNRLNLFLLFLCASSFSVLANPNVFKNQRLPGYILTNDEQKTEGYIIPGSITDNEVKIRFISKTGDKIRSYKPDELLGYGYQRERMNDVGKKVKSWIHYESFIADYPPKPFASKTVFMQKEVDGDIELFCYYIEVRNNPKQPYRFVHYYRSKENNVLRKIEKREFRRMAKKIFQDYTALSTRIGNKNFEYHNLERMVRDYNYWTDNQHDRETYRVALKEN